MPKLFIFIPSFAQFKSYLSCQSSRQLPYPVLSTHYSWKSHSAILQMCIRHSVWCLKGLTFTGYVWDVDGGQNTDNVVSQTRSLRFHSLTGSTTDSLWLRVWDDKSGRVCRTHWSRRSLEKPWGCKVVVPGNNKDSRWFSFVSHASAVLCVFVCVCLNKISCGCLKFSSLHNNQYLNILFKNQIIWQIEHVFPCRKNQKRLMGSWLM